MGAGVLQEWYPLTEEWWVLSSRQCMQDTQYFTHILDSPLTFLVGFDCGVFICMYCYFISMDCSLVFNQDHIDHCWNIIALSIMENCARTSWRVLICKGFSNMSRVQNMTLERLGFKILFLAKYQNITLSQ